MSFEPAEKLSTKRDSALKLFNTESGNSAVSAPCTDYDANTNNTTQHSHAQMHPLLQAGPFGGLGRQYSTGQVLGNDVGFVANGYARASSRQGPARRTP